MEHAIFLSDISARKIMGKIPWFDGRSIKAVPCYERGALKGYKVLLQGKPLTEKSAELLSMS